MSWRVLAAAAVAFGSQSKKRSGCLFGAVRSASLRAARVIAATLNDVFATLRVNPKVAAMVLEAPSDALRWCAAILSSTRWSFPMSREFDPSLDALALGRRRLLQGAAALPMVGLSGLSFAQGQFPTAKAPPSSR
jgi:hypothetical protein